MLSMNFYRVITLRLPPNHLYTCSPHMPLRWKYEKKSSLRMPVGADLAARSLKIMPRISSSTLFTSPLFFYS